MTTLLLIDVQNSFHPGGSLGIPAAGDDAERIASFILSNKSQINRIIATMDSHHKLHIAHPLFWKDENGNHPSPFTVITSSDVEIGKWKPRDDLTLREEEIGAGFMVDRSVCPGEELFDSDGQLNLQNYCQKYTRLLEEMGKFQLTIWPEHCIIGSPGHNIVENVNTAIDEWIAATGCSVEWVLKGQNLLTEMYSALQADVPVSKSTSFNWDLYESLRKSDRLLVCGQASSHCVNYTIRDLVEKWPKEELNKIWILTDCTSAVPTFEGVGSCFLKDMQEAGVNLCTSVEVFGDSKE